MNPARPLMVYDGKMRGIGVDAVVRHELEAMVEAGMHPRLLARRASRIEGVEDRPAVFTVANLLSGLRREVYYGLQKRCISRLGSDLVDPSTTSVVIGWPGRALAAFHKAKQYGLPTILNHDTMHCARAFKNRPDPSWPGIRRFELEAEYDLADRILAPSQYSLETFSEAGLDPAKLALLGRGVDVGRFAVRPEPRPGDPFRLLFLGRVCERKGIRQVVEAWVRAALDHAELLVVGELDEEVKDVAASAPASIHWLGHRSVDLPEILSQCDAQILLSRNEGMAKSLLEGAACGLATLATVQCGFPMREGINGYHVPRKGPYRISEKIRYLARDRGACYRMGLEARRDMETQWTWAHFKKRFIEFLG